MAAMAVLRLAMAAVPGLATTALAMTTVAMTAVAVAPAVPGLAMAALNRRRPRALPQPALFLAPARHAHHGGSGRFKLPAGPARPERLHQPAGARRETRDVAP